MSYEISLRDLQAGGLLCRASLLSTRAQGGHPAHLERAQVLANEARRLAPEDVAIVLFAARLAVERLDLRHARRLLEPFAKGRSPHKEAISLLGFVLEAENDREKARATYLHLRVLRAAELAEDGLRRLDQHPALYQPAGAGLLRYAESANPADPAVQLAFLRAAERPGLLREMAEAALPLVAPVTNNEVFALIDELRRSVIRRDLARLVSSAFLLCTDAPAAQAAAEDLARDPLEDRARAGGAALTRRGLGPRAAELLLANEAISMDTRAWALAFAPETARPHLAALTHGLAQEDARFLRGFPALLAGLGSEGAAHLLALLQNATPNKALESVSALLLTEDPRGPEYVAEHFLGRGMPHLRRDGYEEIARAGGTAWISLLYDAAPHEPDFEARQEAVLALYALAGLDPEAAAEPLSFFAEYESDRELKALVTSLLQGKRLVRRGRE
jgi:hypothetical protein